MQGYIQSLSAEQNSKCSESFISAHMSSQYETTAHYFPEMYYIHIYDMETTKSIYSNKVSSNNPFAKVPHDRSW